MAARSMFRGLAFVVFLSVVSPVWMVVNYDLSNCNVEKITPKDIFLQDLKGNARFYVTGQTKELFVNNTITELVTFTMLNNGTLLGAMSMMFMNGTDVICTNITSVVGINKDMKRFEIATNKRMAFHCYLIDSNEEDGQFAWFCQIVSNGVPLNDTKFFTLWSVDPLLPAKPNMIKDAAFKMCNGLRVNSELFDSYSVETSMTEGCRFVSPSLIFHSTSSAVPTMPSVFLSMTLLLLVLYL